MSVVIKLKRGNSSDWTSQNIILASGEPGYEINTGRFKIGNGLTAWSGLPYASVVPTGLLAGSGININLGTNGSTATISVSGLNSSNISDFNSAVSGLLPVKNISSGSGINVSSTTGNFTISVSGLNSTYISNFNEAVDDRIGSGLFVAGTGINLTYNDAGNSFTVSTTGLISNPTNNRILTSRDSTTTGIDAESNLTFDGTTLSVTGVIDIDNLRLDGNTISSTNNNGNIIIQPSGSGALQRDSGGNPRGSYAIDWQTERFDNNQVASGPRSVIGGGTYNRAAGQENVIGGGNGNLTDELNSVIGGGSTNKAIADYSSVFGGTNNIASGDYSFIGGGDLNSISGQFGAILGGQHNNDGGYNNVFILGSNLSGIQPNTTYTENLISHSGRFTSLTVNNTGVSLVGHTHSSSNITDFNSSVSGLLPVKNILAGSGISVLPVSGNYTISVSGISIQGIQGLQGEQGIQGIQGSDAYMQGTQGVQGVQGLAGSDANMQGTQGIQGEQGTQGIQGEQGTQGIQGEQGTQGIQGIQGIQGSDASMQGTQGAQGEGIQGIQGIQGSDASMQGIQGIQGEQGTQGIQGEQGIQGIQGEQGIQGIQGIRGPEINWTGEYNSATTYYVNNGVSYNGSSYVAIQNGFMNIDPTNAANWQLIAAQGIQGLQGIQGEGIQGIQGSDASMQGSQGIQGEQGIQGIQGIQGEQGVQGIQGLDGIQGTQGITGANGGSSSYFLYRTDTASTVNSDPGSGNVRYDNATQTSATALYIDHLTRDNIDIDLFLALLQVDDKILIQDQNDSNNYQQFKVSGAINIGANTYVQVPVTFVTSSGTGTTGFANNHQVILVTTAVGIQGTQGIQGIQGLQGESIQGIQGIQGGGGGASSKLIDIFTPLDNQPPASNFATLDTRNSIAVLDFDDTTEESAVFVGFIPENISLTSGIIVNTYWMATTATTGNVRWGAQFEKMNTDLDSDSFDTATEAHSVTNGTAGIISQTSITCTTIDSLAVGDLFRVKIYRDTTDTTNDTVTGDAEIVAIVLTQAAT